MEAEVWALLWVPMGQAPCDKKGTIKYIQEKEKVYGGGGGEVKEGLLGTPLPL